jgi:hypothetical protein
MYHGTRARHVDAILEHGLKVGGVEHGIRRPHSDGYTDDLYGIRPVFLSLVTTFDDSYEWEDFEADEPEMPVLLEVDVRTLRVLPDVEHLRIPLYAWVEGEGISWPDLRSAIGLRRDPSRTPKTLAPYLNEDGFIPWHVLMNEAAEVAITLTRTVAVLSDIAPSLIALHDRAG